MIISAPPSLDSSKIISSKEMQVPELATNAQSLSEFEAVFQANDITTAPSDFKKSLELSEEDTDILQEGDTEEKPASDNPPLQDNHVPLDTVSHIQAQFPALAKVGNAKETDYEETADKDPIISSGRINDDLIAEQKPHTEDDVRARSELKAVPNILSSEKPVLIASQLIRSDTEQKTLITIEQPLGEQAQSQPMMVTTKSDAAPVLLATNFALSNSPNKSLDLMNEAQWINQLSTQITELAEGKDKIQFQLNPVHLGKLKVEIIQSLNGDTIKMETQTEEARQIITLSQGRLEQDIRQTGSRITGIDISTEPSGFAQQSNNKNDTRSGANSYQDSQKKVVTVAEDQGAMPHPNTPTQAALSQSERYA